MVRNLTYAVKNILPVPILNGIRRGLHTVRKIQFMIRQRQQRKRENARSAQEVFSEIYEKNLWGGEEGKFYSGPGSRFATGEQYVKTIIKFIKDYNVSTVLDLGCGDFEIGKKIAMVCDDYMGVDVVPKLIAKNTQLYGNDRVKFVCADITQGNLPGAELCLIRQVLQHMSNQEILSVLNEVRKYPYLIVTEHHPNNPSCYNMDKAHGSGTRVEFGSGVYLDRAPFNAGKVQVLLEMPAMSANEHGEPVAVDWGLIRTCQVML